MDFSHIEEKTTSPVLRSAMKKAPVLEDHEDDPIANSEEDWLASLDEDIDAIATNQDAAYSPTNSDYAPAEESLPPSPFRPASITIRGRALEASKLETSETSVTSSTSSPRNAVSGVSTSHVVPNGKNDGAVKTQSNGHREVPPHLMDFTGSRTSSPPVSTVSAATKSHVSSAPSSRITLGAAAAGWKFDQRSKPFEREYTIDPKRARSQQPPIFRHGYPSHPPSVFNSIRRAPPVGPPHNGVRGQGLPPRPMGAMNGGRPMSRFSGPSPPFTGIDRNTNVEIRITNVPPTCSKDDLYSILGEYALHRAPFSSRERKLNFWYVLLPLITVLC